MTVDRDPRSDAAESEEEEVTTDLRDRVSLRRRILNVRTIGSLIFGLLLLYLLSRVLFSEDFDWSEVARLVGQADIGFLLLAFGAYYATLPVRGFRWR